MSIDYDTWLQSGLDEYFAAEDEDEEVGPDEPDFEDPPLSKYD